jgi:hypothetical protein
MTNPYVVTCGARAKYNPLNAAASAENNALEMRYYEFTGNLDNYDVPQQLSLDGHVLHEGYKATALLHRALAAFESMPSEEQEGVISLLKHIFDPTGIVCVGEPFRQLCVYKEPPSLMFTWNVDRFTKLCVRYKPTEGTPDRKLWVWCVSHHKLAEKEDVQVA